MIRFRNILRLVLLLTWLCLGMVGSARAGFALVLTTGAEEIGNSGAFTGNAGHDERLENERVPEHTALPRRLSTAWPGLPTTSSSGGMSSSSPGSAPGGSGLIGALTVACPPLGAEAAERMFLVDERFKPPPFSSRLFRPPR
jgi:hypothetical protein